MIGTLALSAALLALYGAAHCAAMCGGFVASLGLRRPRRPAHGPRAGFMEPLWRKAGALARRMGPLDTLPKRLGLGALWGWALGVADTALGAFCVTPLP